MDESNLHTAPAVEHGESRQKWQANEDKDDEVQERQGTGLRRAGEDITILLGALTKVGEDEAANDTE